MYCPSCGQQITVAGNFCAACGASLAGVRPDGGDDPEPVLCRCGPMGIGVSFARPGFFVPTQQNCTEIVATDRRLYGVRKMPAFVFARHRREAGKLIFEVPYGRILAVEPADYLLNKALWIRYRDGDQAREVGIEAPLPWHGHILRLRHTLQGWVRR